MRDKKGQAMSDLPRVRESLIVKACRLTITDEAVLRMPDMPDDEFLDFCEANPEYRIERGGRGKVSILPGTGGRTGDRNSKSTPNCAPSRARLHRAGCSTPVRCSFCPAEPCDLRTPRGSRSQRDRFLPVAPDFVIELTPPSDRLRDAQQNVSEWMGAGCELGWLMDPSTKKADVHRAGSQRTFDEPAQLAGEGPVEGFVLELGQVWDPGW
jgi:Uma2 family endonuclease